MSITQVDSKALESRLRSQMGDQIENLKVESCDEGWVVSGRVESFYLKQLVTEAIRDLSEHGTVNNIIGVKRKF